MYTDKNGNRWYRGNLHTHTTVSDGVKTPEETKAIYRSLGYDFIALTDHWEFGEGSDNDESGLVVLSGIEYNFGGSDMLTGVFHIVGIGMDTVPNIERTDDTQTAIDRISECGGLPILAHPAWSMNTYDKIMPLNGVFATEIYNSVSDLPFNCRPYSGIVIDDLALRGYTLPLLATDDTHFHKGEVGKGYIMVNLGDKPLNRENLMAALREGKFIATQGPIFTCKREGDEIVVTCETGAARVTFFTGHPYEKFRSTVAEGEPIYEARFKITKGTVFVRAEICDAEGKLGFANVIFE
ncbi:MAG: CehA/McbA family metallohydrolase [Clostridia bacterium]|nr:CehA/McbA family metallohydrolase [Clostridia bacterium]